MMEETEPDTLPMPPATVSVGSNELATESRKVFCYACLRWFWKAVAASFGLGFFCLDLYLGWGTTNWLLGSVPCPYEGDDAYRCPLAPGKWSLDWRGLVLDVAMTATTLGLLLLAAGVMYCVVRSTLWLDENRVTLPVAKRDPEKGGQEFVQFDRTQPTRTVAQAAKQDMPLEVLMAFWGLVGLALGAGVVVSLLYASYGIRLAVLGSNVHFNGWIFAWLGVRIATLAVCGGLIVFSFHVAVTI